MLSDKTNQDTYAQVEKVFNRKGCSIIDYTDVKTRYHLGYKELWHLVWSKGKILKMVKRNYLDR